MKFDISLLTFFRNHGIVLELTQKQLFFVQVQNYNRNP